MNILSLLKQLVLPVSISALVIMTGCSDSSSSNGVAGQYSMNTSGARGGSDNGNGSSANYIDIGKFSNGALKVLSTGSADASFSMQNHTGNLGAVPLTVSSNTTIDVFTIGSTRPAAGVAYYIQNDWRLYLSPGGGTIIGGGDAEDGQIVSGLQIDSGVTLTLGLNYLSYAYINLVNDIINYGTMTTADFNALNRGALSLYCASYIASGSIDLSGTLAGQNGGGLSTGIDTFFNSGDINTSGGNDDVSNNAGNGGYINFLAYYFGQNSGNFNSSGGNASTAGNIAGAAGTISLISEWGYLHNSGDMTARGGNGDFAGNGNSVLVEAEAAGASAELLNSGDINTSGGDASAGNAGAAGNASLYAYGGRLINNASITSRGGNTSDLASNGGTAGSINIYHAEGHWFNAFSPATETLISGNIDSRGGDAVANGTGNAGSSGSIDIYQYNFNEPEVSARMEVAGYTGFTLSGGDGNSAGSGGSVDIYQDWSDITATNGDVLNEVNITANGGNVSSGSTTTPFMAGNGGYAYIYTSSDSGSLNDTIKRAENSGDFSANGGTGSINSTSNNFAYAGSLSIYGYNGAKNSGTVDISGGADTGADGATDGYGGRGGYLNIAADNSVSRNTGDVIANGGDGEYDGGNGGSVGIYGTDAINTADISANGGNADALLTDSRGGNGGWIELSSPTGDASLSGTVSLTGGTGENSLFGLEGSTMVGGFCTGPTC